MAAVSGSVAATRVLELEIEKWEAEQDKMEAEKEAKKARCQLEQMEIKVGTDGLQFLPAMLRLQ